MRWISVVLAVVAAAFLALRLAARGGEEAPLELPPAAERAPDAGAEVELLKLAPPPPEASPPTPAATPSRWGPTVRAYLDSGPSDYCLDIVFVGDGYLASQLEDGTYWADVERIASGLLAEIPFVWYRTSINVRAVFLASKTEGCDIAWDRDRIDTALDCAFDSTKGRGLWLRNTDALRLALRPAGDADAVFVMINTKFYGGGGGGKRIKVPGGSFRIATFTPRHPTSVGIAIHELGHSLAGLEDEYANPGDEESYPLPPGGKDVPGPNVQVEESFDRTDRDSLARTVKWGRFLGLPGAEKHSWLHEGGYYRRIGVWRPWPTCRMRTHVSPFCPVCCAEVAKAIVRKTGRAWDDRAYHAAHPLSLWEK